MDNPDSWLTFGPGRICRRACTGCFNINFLDKKFLEEFEAAIDKDKPVYIYCASGNRSGKAKSALEKAGYKYIYNLTGAGYAQWSGSRLSTEQ